MFAFADQASSNPTFYADITDPQSLNKYQYCYNNPLLFVDPDGHQQKQSLKEQIKQALSSIFDSKVKSKDLDNNPPKDDRGYGPGGRLPSARDITTAHAEKVGEGADLLYTLVSPLDISGAGGAAKAGFEYNQGKGSKTALAVGFAGLVFGSMQAAEALNIVKQAGTHEVLKLSGPVKTTVEYIPTRQEAEKLIAAAGGTIDRVEKAHKGAGHAFPHINYHLGGDPKNTATIQVQSVGKQFYRAGKKIIGAD